MGQVGTRILRWNGITEDFQEECYHIPDIVQDEFQAVQGQITWVARRGQDTSDHLAFVEHELKSLWVQVRLEQKYLRHLIKKHVLYLQSSNSSACCQCPILGDFRQSPIPALFRDLHSEVSSGHVSPPPLESVTNWHFSRSFRFIFLNTYDHYPSGLILSTSPHSFQTISPTHFVHRRTENTWIEFHNVAYTVFVLQRATRFKANRNTSSIVWVKPPARPSKTPLPPGSKNPLYHSSRS